MAPVAKRLSSRFVVLELLQRGSGTLPLTVNTHVADLHESLQELSRPARVRLVGFSWGAMLALAYVARHGEGVDRVVAIGCGTFDAHTRRVCQTRMAERMDDKTRSRLGEIQVSLDAERDQRTRDRLFAELGRIYTRLQAFNPRHVGPDEPSSCDERAFRETWADVLSLQEKGVQPAEFSGITCPVTMLHGEADPHPGRLIYESLRPFIGNLAYIKIPRCGHKPWIERQAAEPFYAALVRCLA
jgi:pimeloyl-ACP methyl ester carboxylesterase